MEQNAKSILVVDDEVEMRTLLKDILEEHGYAVTFAQEGKEALEQLSSNEALVVLTDLRMKGIQGMELLHEVVQQFPRCNVIIMVAFGTVETAVEAMKQGAFDYLTKPIKTDELLLTVEKVMREALLRQEVALLRQ